MGSPQCAHRPDSFTYGSFDMSIQIIFTNPPLTQPSNDLAMSPTELRFHLLHKFEFPSLYPPTFLFLYTAISFSLPGYAAPIASGSHSQGEVQTPRTENARPTKTSGEKTGYCPFIGRGTKVLCPHFQNQTSPQSRQRANSFLRLASFRYVRPSTLRDADHTCTCAHARRDSYATE
jgi:hypothetical protein